MLTYVRTHKGKPLVCACEWFFVHILCFIFFLVYLRLRFTNSTDKEEMKSEKEKELREEQAVVTKTFQIETKGVRVKRPRKAPSKFAVQ